METTFSNGFLASDQQPDDVARSTARDAGKQPSRFQLPKLFTDGETETHAPSTVTSTEPGINYTYYRVKTEVHKPQQESSPQPEVPPTAASQHVIVAEAVAMPSAEQTIMAEGYRSYIEYSQEPLSHAKAVCRYPGAQRRRVEGSPQGGGNYQAQCYAGCETEKRAPCTCANGGCPAGRRSYLHLLPWHKNGSQQARNPAKLAA
jgi:hypothetical protein